MKSRSPSWGWGTPHVPTPVNRTGNLAAWNLVNWTTPLQTNYPSNVGLATRACTNPAAQVNATGQNQAGDPRAMQSGLWKIAALTNNAKLAGQNGAVIGGSNINIGSGGISTPMIIILVAAILLFIWK